MPTTLRTLLAIITIYAKQILQDKREQIFDPNAYKRLRRTTRATTNNIEDEEEDKRVRVLAYEAKQATLLYGSSSPNLVELAIKKIQVSRYIII